MDSMLIWCDEKIGEVDGVSQYTVAGTLHLRPQPPSTVVPILLQHIAMRRIPQFTRQLHGLDSVSYWAARREMIRWLYVQDCVFLIRNRESTFCLVSDATSVTENSSEIATKTHRDPKAVLLQHILFTGYHSLFSLEFTHFHGISLPESSKKLSEKS